MAPHSRELHEMALAHFNEPMLTYYGLARCVGYAETAVDCYIIAHAPQTESEDERLVWLTCVGGYTWLDRLKGQGYVKADNGEDWDDLTRLSGDLTRAGAPPADVFILELKHNEWEGMRPRGAVKPREGVEGIA